MSATSGQSLSQGVLDGQKLMQALQASLGDAAAGLVGSRMGSKVMGLSEKEVDEISKAVAAVSKEPGFAFDSTTGAAVNNAVQFEGFNVYLFRRLLLHRLGINSLDGKVSYPSLVNPGETVTSSGQDKYAHYITAAVVIVLQRGTNMFLTSPGFRKTSESGKRIISTVIQALSIRDVNQPGKFDVTWSRIVSSNPDLAMMALSNGLGRVIGAVPRSLPPYYAFPGAAMMIPEEHLEAYGVYCMSFDRAIKKNKAAWTKVQTIKQFIEAARSSKYQIWNGQKAGGEGFLFPDEPYYKKFIQNMTPDRVTNKVQMTEEVFAAMALEYRGN